MPYEFCLRERGTDGELTGNKDQLRVDTEEDGKGQITGLRVIFDPFGDDSDVLLESTEQGLSVIFHPGGFDAMLRVTMNQDKVTVVVDRHYKDMVEVQEL